MAKLYGAIIWFVVTLFVVYAFCLNTAAGVFSDAIKTSLHANNVSASIATGAFICGFALMQIPAGYLLDKFNARFVVSAGVLLLALGNLFTAYSTNLIAFTLSNFLQGIGASFAFIAVAVVISQWFSARFFPILFGLTQTLSCILAGVIHYYFTVALTIYKWNQLYFVLAIFGFALLVLTVLTVKSPDNDKREASISLKESLTNVFSNNQILLCSLSAAASFGVLLAYAGLWYMQVQSYYSVDTLHAVIISGMIFLGLGLGTPLWGWISNKVKSRLAVIHVTLCLGTMALLLGLYLPHFNVNTLLITQSISFLIGFFLSGSMLFYTMVSEIATNSTRGVALSVLNTAVFISNTIMLFIPYLFITTLSTNFFTYLWVLPFCILISILLLYFIKDTYKPYEDIES